MNVAYAVNLVVFGKTHEFAVHLVPVNLPVKQRGRSKDRPIGMNIVALRKASLDGIVELIASENLDCLPSDQPLQPIRLGRVT
jgi:hypothetical protein